MCKCVRTTIVFRKFKDFAHLFESRHNSFSTHYIVTHNAIGTFTVFLLLFTTSIRKYLKYQEESAKKSAFPYK